MSSLRSVGNAWMMRAVVVALSLGLSGCFSYTAVPASQLGVVQQWCGVPPAEQQGFRITAKTKIKHYYDQWESLCEATYLPRTGTIRLRNPDIGGTIGAILATAAFVWVIWLIAAQVRAQGNSVLY